MRRHTLAIVDSVTELGDLGLVSEATAQVRVHPAPPMFKLYLINNEEAFFGFYPVREHVIKLRWRNPGHLRLMGKDAILFHHSTTPPPRQRRRHVYRLPIRRPGPHLVREPVEHRRPGLPAMTPAELLEQADALLLDFGGPVCSVFAGIPAATVADQLRTILAAGGHPSLPIAVALAEDPFDVFRSAATLGDDEARYVEAAFTAHEIEAVTSSVPASGAHELIHGWHLSNRPLAIVSNNSAVAIEAYLNLYGLAKFVDLVSA